jgi:catechol 2,3-dioxygenase-like lactoylglutathione lyase family enzyme
MPVRLGAIVLFTSSLDATVSFYRAIGIDLAKEDHDDGVPHFAAELDGCHFAVFPATGTSRSPGLRVPGCSFAGIAVASVRTSVESVRDLGAPVLEDPTPYPWGVRAVVEDPDGRPVEIFEPLSTE